MHAPLSTPLWSSAILSSAIIVCLWCHTPTTNAQLLFASPSNIQQQYQPLINVAFPPNETTTNAQSSPSSSSSSSGNRWTPVHSARGSAVQLNSAYTAINPSSSVSPSSSVPFGKYAAPVAASLAKAVPVTSTVSQSATHNSTYVFSESIARGSYQKPQSTYMIQPAKYRQAFPSVGVGNASGTVRNGTTKSGRSLSGRKSNKSATNSKLVANSEAMPIPMIKPHRHGATLGFNLPDQGLTLYLDINELATKPMAQNIGLKVVSHNTHDHHKHDHNTGDTTDKDKDSSTENNIESLNEVKPSKSESSPKTLRKRVTKVVKRVKDSLKSANSTVATASKSQTVKSSKQTTKEQTTAVKVAKSALNTSTSSKKIRFGTKTKTSGSSLGGAKVNIPSPAQANKAKQQVIEIPSLNHEVNINPNKIFDDIEIEKTNGSRNDIPPTASRIPATYVSQVEYKGDEEEQRNTVAQKKEGEVLSNNGGASNSEEASSVETDGGDNADVTKETVSSGEALSEAIRTEREDEIEREKQTLPTITATVNGADETDDETETNETETDSESATVSSEEPEEEETEAEAEEEAEEMSVTTTATPSAEDLAEPTTVTTTVAPNTAPTVAPAVEEALRLTTTTIPLEQSVPDSVLNSSLVHKQELVDHKVVQQMQSLIERSAKLIDQSSTCSAVVERCRRDHSCAPHTNSVTTDTATTVREIAQQLDAHLILNEVANSFENELQDSMDFSTAGYTILLPSNAAVGRLPPSLLRRWKQTGDGLALDVYLLEGVHTLESMLAKRTITTRGGKAKLHVANAHNESVTINGQRVVYANQKAPGGGMVHVIDGLLYPHADKDIIDTLKACGRLDGFVTLAEGTGFSHTLKREGPFTVFVPSNDALQKVPDNDLELIRRNMTALREFLKYHVAQGVHYSQDLMDGQFLPSLLEGEYLQAGVRVDGCTRRLVEVNVSPLYRADIPASNGVIHVVDWILKPDDRDWCNGVILPRRR